MKPEIIPWGQIVLCSILVAAGLVLHFVSKLKELEDRGLPVSANAYLTDHKYTAIYVVLSAYGLLLLAYFTGEMGPVGSFCMGVAANVAGDKLRARAEAKLNSQPSVPPGA
jgi:hypothetical protein